MGSMMQLKFQIGEEVTLQSKTHPELDGEYCIRDIVLPGTTRGLNGLVKMTRVRSYIVYDLGILIDEGTSVFVWESELRKKFKPSNKSFHQLMSELKVSQA